MARSISRLVCFRIDDAAADACYSQTLNETMPMIYKRFTEKAAEEWRQIYKVCEDVSAERSPH